MQSRTWSVSHRPSPDGATTGQAIMESKSASASVSKRSGGLKRRSARTASRLTRRWPVLHPEYPEPMRIFLLLLYATLAFAQPADLVLRNGKIVSMNAAQDE